MPARDVSPKLASPLHWDQQWREPLDSLLPGFKRCKKCKSIKTVEDFHVDRLMRDGLKARCRICTNKTKAKWRKANQEKVNRSKKEHYERNREHYLAYMRSSERRTRMFQWKLERKFGITVERFEELMEIQNGCCAICKRPPSEVNGHKHKHRLCIDHCHRTGKVRGLLCTMCNAAIGYLEDCLERVESAKQYLEQHLDKTAT